MFDQKHYVPILKTKAGELWSLRHLNLKWRPLVTPVLEIHNPPKKKDEPPKPMPKHVDDVCTSIRKCWGTTNPFFIDTEWLNLKNGAPHALATALNACRARGLKSIPVVKIGYDRDALDVVKAAIVRDGRGCMLRLDAEDAGAHSVIHRVMDYLGLQKSEVHLLIDYRENPMNLAADVPNLPSINEWMTFSAASAAFPKTVSTLEPQTWIDIPRNDWNTWERSTVKDKLSRKPTFSDYGTRCPGPPPGGGDPIVHLRYTRKTKWMVYSHGTLQSGDADNMRLICRKLILLKDFDGREFSDGDSEINRIGNQWDERGGATQWLQWCLNHHLTFVARQIQSHAAL